MVLVKYFDIVPISSWKLGPCKRSLITGFSLRTSKRLNKLIQCKGRVVTHVGSLGREGHSLVGFTGDSSNL